jgi:hypothetical protein
MYFRNPALTLPALLVTIVNAVPHLLELGTATLMTDNDLSGSRSTLRG